MVEFFQKILLEDSIMNLLDIKKSFDLKFRRPPSEVMTLEKMGSCFPTRLSFMRILIRKLIKNKSYVKTHEWQMDNKGFGHAVFTINIDKKHYSLIAFSNHLDDTMRTDRVIASAWDTSFALFDGIPENKDIERLRKQLPLQEAGRFSKKELVISRANKSVRLFKTVTEMLSKGVQPSKNLINEIGYFMRTTAVYGNGKFGIRDRQEVKLDAFMLPPFQVEMLTVYLIRHFSVKLVHHVAKNLNETNFVFLDKNIQRHIGIGNSTGLGMAPFLVKHPILINNWLMVKESALTRMLDKEKLTDFQKRRVLKLIDRAFYHLKEWSTDDKRQQNRINNLRNEWKKIKIEISNKLLSKSYPLNYLFNTTRNYSTECHELMVSLILEIGGKDIDDLEHCLESSKDVSLKPDMKIFELTDFINKNYDWALKINFDLEEANSKFWYVSEEKLEPRLGNRFSENGSELEQPLDIAKKVQALNNDLKDFSRDLCIAEFLMKYPSHRYIVKRVQTNMWAPYSEIQSNLIGNNCLPIDMLRFKLSFFGASKFDPKSDKWTRVNLFQGAPLAEELPLGKNDDWWLPALSCN